MPVYLKKIENLKEFKSVDEVALSCMEDNLILVVYKGIVYNVTVFIDFHPGGEAIIREHIGEDITKVFDNGPLHKHSSNALYMLEEYRYGKIVD